MAVIKIEAKKDTRCTQTICLIQGDRRTQILRFGVNRYDGGVDLSDLVWAIKTTNAKGVDDVFKPAAVEISESKITIDWLVDGTVTDASGMAKYELNGLDATVEGKAVVWKGGTGTMSLRANIGENFGEIDMTNIDRLVLYVEGRLQDIIDLADSLQNGVDGANAAAAVANTAAGNANTAASAANSAASAASTAAGNANAATAAANTATAAANAATETANIAAANVKADVDRLSEEIADLSTYVTPEMFGAVKDGTTDDADAIQAAIDYAIANNVGVQLDGKYAISKSIIVDKKSTYGIRGVTIEGNNSLVTINANAPAIIVRGNLHTFSNLHVTYALSLESDKKCNYTSPLVRIEASYENTAFACLGNKFTNITLGNNWDKDLEGALDSIGFEFYLKSSSGIKTYAYLNRFVGCSCWYLGTAIKVTEEGESLGCNANQFDISSWCCDKYIDGVTGGCSFEGTVQSNVSAINHDRINAQYLVTNIGENNMYCCIFYDTNYTATQERQYIADTSKLGKYTTFTQVQEEYAFFGSVHSINAKFSRKITSTKYNMPLNMLDSASVENVFQIIPFKNSFSALSTATMECENATTSYWGSGYGALGDNGIPVNIAYLFGDNYKERHSGMISCSPDATVKIKFDIPDDASIYSMFLYYGVYDYYPESAELHLYKDGSDTPVVVTSKSRQKANGRCVDAFFTYSRNATYKRAEIVFKHNTGGTGKKTFMISQICGTMLSEWSGIV